MKPSSNSPRPRSLSLAMTLSETIASNSIYAYCKNEKLIFTVLYRKLGVDSEMKEYKLMPHGFLSYNFPLFGMRDESLAGIRAAGEYLRELL
jgi:hypothetical protein